MSNVPNTETFTLQDVFSAVSSHAESTAGNLSSCFNNAVFSYFDPTYNNDSYALENSMLRFRNYTISNSPVIIQLLNVTQVVPDNLDFNVDRYNAIIRMTNNSSSPISCSFGVDMQFNTAVPSDQTERGTTRIDITPAYGETTGSGRIITLNRTAQVGDTDINIVVLITNDNWDDIGFYRSFTIKLATDTNSVLGVNSEYTSSVHGIRTCYWRVTKKYSSIGIGDILSIWIEQLGYKHDVGNGILWDHPMDGYAKAGQFIEHYSTGGYSTEKAFIQINFDENNYNYYTNTYKEQDTSYTEIPLNYNNLAGYKLARYALRNGHGEFGLSANFSYGMHPGDYTKFLDANNNDIASISHSSTVYSSSGAGHIVFFENFINNKIYLNAVPNGTSLNLGDNFGVRFRIFGTGSVYYNGTYYYGGDVIYPVERYFTTHLFRSNGGTDDLSIAGGVSNDTTGTFIFSNYDTYLHLEVASGNIEIDQSYPNVIGKSGIIQVE